MSPEDQLEGNDAAEELAEGGSGVAPAAPPAAAPVEPAAEPLAGPGSAGRRQRASAAKASALVSSWADDETAPFTDVVGGDLFVTGRHRAAGERRRERERQRDGGAAAARPRRATAGHSRVLDEYEYGLPAEELAEEDFDGEDEVGAAWTAAEAPRARCPSGGAAGRRRSAVPETVAAGRPKRQRTTKADPDMLDTDAALDEAFEEGGSAGGGDGAQLEAPRTRARAPRQPSPLPPSAAPLPTPAPVAPLLPAVAPGTVGLTAPLPTAPRPLSAGVTAAAARAARAPSPAIAAALGAAAPRDGTAAEPVRAPAAAQAAPAAAEPAAEAAAPPAASSAAADAPSALSLAAFDPAALMAAQAAAAAAAARPSVALPVMMAPSFLPAFQPAAPFDAATMFQAAGFNPVAAFQAAGLAQPTQFAATHMLHAAPLAPAAPPGAAPVPAPAAKVEAAAPPPMPQPQHRQQLPQQQEQPAAPPVPKAEPWDSPPPPPPLAALASGAAPPPPAVWPETAHNGSLPGAGAGADPGSSAGRRTHSRQPVDVLYGCAKCRYLRSGCTACRTRDPAFTRPRMRWKPDQGHHQRGVEPAPVFRPTPEEFRDPIAYVSKIRPQAEKYGLAHIVPPPGWDPPFALERGTNGLSMESFRFQVRKQYTSHLCCRGAHVAPAPGTPPAGGAEGGAAGADGRYTGRMCNSLRGGAADASEASAQPDVTQQPEAQQQQGQQGGAVQQGVGAGVPPPAAAAAPAAVQAAGGSASEPPSPPTDFGFPHLDKRHTLRSFAAYADWVKEIHFSDPLPQPVPRSAGASSRATRTSQRRPRALPNQSTLPEPSIEQIEAEFWRIVESPEQPVESLYGQDVDSGHHGSGFPLPLWRRRLLERHLSRQAHQAGNPAADVRLPNYSDELERQYAEHPWNINNMPRAANSVLRYLPGTDGELITGVMVPWLYVGSCLSAFCWHVEDHALCSINYHHMGAPKVWYGVPASATGALEEAVRDALPHLVAANPRLLYQLVTALAPAELHKRGVPVYRVLHEPGSFVVTMPDAYHSGFNCGFNVAEAVNFAPSDWIPYGADVAEKYRATKKPLTLSHDSLMVTLVQAAQHKPPPGGPAGGAQPGQPPVQPQPVEQQQQQVAERQQRVQPAAAVGGQDPLGPLGPAPLHQAPPQGIALAAGELALRAAEERRRRMVAFVGVGALPERRMASDAPPGAKDASGVHVNTTDCDCAQCSGDLWLSAVVSPAAPGVVVCPEHAEVLVRRHGCPRSSLVLLYRHSPAELDSMVQLAVERVPAAAVAVASARQRRAAIEAGRIRAVPAGPMYQLQGPGQPAGALPLPDDGDGCCESDEERDSDGEWETEQHAQRGRSGAKRRRSSGGAQRQRGSAGGSMMRMAGRMAGKRARTGEAPEAPSRMGGAAAPAAAAADGEAEAGAAEAPARQETSRA
ncbi:lysine-specific demethylase JMJ16 [Micractinium conductrix]|uniref:Lysine-specific demethylase JMJ16 n=1 Tax=Micractinium conductrix TaxID=554055 RepID=A0A2P6V8A0_9CHLO|nr:lysine-specific demethylase JMJ16 [Micractinium conductrix]|eukprot:PSC70309.1 lysine-specific demethylase JMJ16 [Micractinium conductrix]